MVGRENYFFWQWDLRSSPEALWPLVADTNRFDRDAGLPPVSRHGTAGDAGRQVLSIRKFGMQLQWEEFPFEWVRPQRYGVLRRYRSGPLRELRMRARLEPLDAGGTRLTYEIFATPRNWIGAALIRGQIGIATRRSFEKIFRQYDRSLADPLPSAAPGLVELAPGGAERLERACAATLEQGGDADTIERLRQRIISSDELMIGRIRPYALADEWKSPRRAVLETCLCGTRAGLLEFRWDVMCPLCRGAKQSEGSLSALSRRVHCDACLIDFDVNFDRLVELTFRPSASIRPDKGMQYCVGGPGLTPHIVVQQRLAPGESRMLDLALENGRHRVRGVGIAGGQLIDVSPAGETRARIDVRDAPWPRDEIRLATRAELTLSNFDQRERLVVIERMAWTDQCTTAAEVIAMQVFRDLFAEEALRPGEEVSVGSLCILFTDLRDSTRLYRAIGDAPAFGRVMSHFDILRDAIAAENGALVKTIGDAVMAVFPRPVCAVRAIQVAQQRLAKLPHEQPLILKAGIHFGPCIAVTLNGRLDYFGSTVNLAARLQGLSRGADLIVSDAVRRDPEVSRLIGTDSLEPIQTALKGFDDERFELWRMALPRTG